MNAVLLSVTGTRGIPKVVKIDRRVLVSADDVVERVARSSSHLERESTTIKYDIPYHPLDLQSPYVLCPMG